MVLPCPVHAFQISHHEDVLVNSKQKAERERTGLIKPYTAN